MHRDDRGWGEGWWESTVCWLEIPEKPEDPLSEVVKTFYSDAERTAYLQKKVDEGRIFDICWVSESIFGGKGHPNVPILSREEWDARMAGKD